MSTHTDQSPRSARPTTARPGVAPGRLIGGPRHGASRSASTASSGPRSSSSPAVAFIVLAALLTKGRPLSGVDGLLAADQLQYFAWIREAAHHGLIGNRFDLAPGDRAFLHPGFASPAACTRSGCPSRSPTCCGSRSRSASRSGVPALRPPPAPAPGAAPRRAGARAVRGHARVVARGVVGLGRQPAPVHVRLHLRRDVVRAVPVGLPDDRDRGVPDAARAARPRARRARGWAAAGALLVCWLQPWQGATLGADHPGVEAWRRRRASAPRSRPRA